MRRTTWWCVAAVVTAVVASGCSEPADDTAATSDDPPTDVSCAGAAMLECARDGSLGDLVPDEPVAAEGEPFTIGMINQENTPAGSYPELSQAANAAIEFVNEQLGGLDGRPIRLEVCNTKFSAEGSTTCGQQMVEAGVPVVLGGIDVFGTGVDVLESNSIAFAGGIPVSEQSVQGTTSFQWSGGSWGATVAFAEYAAKELDAKKVAIVFGEFGSITQAAEYGKRVLDGYGVETQLVPYPILATDVSSPIQAAAASDPDAIFVLAADAGCKASFEAMQTLQVTAAKFFVGACAAPPIVESVDVEATNGVIFNVEGPISGDEPTIDADAALYNAVVDQYGDGLDPVGAGTVTFRAFMNLYMILRDLGADGSTAEAITAELAAQRDAPSFMGHDYTCDREQFAGLPAMCSPQQILVQMDDRVLTQLGSWVDVGAIYGA